MTSCNQMKKSACGRFFIRKIKYAADAESAAHLRLNLMLLSKLIPASPCTNLPSPDSWRCTAPARPE